MADQSVTIAPYPIGPLRQSADQGLLESLQYLLIRAQTGGLEVGGPLDKVQSAQQSLCAGSKRLRAVAFELHHLLYLALRSGAVPEVERHLKPLATIELLTGATPEVEAIFSPETSAEDQIFVELILPEYRATTPSEPTINPPELGPFSQTKANVSEALLILQTVDKYSADEVAVLVDRFTVLKSDTIKAGTSIRSFGRIWLEQAKPTDDWFSTLEMLVHELAHLHLYLLQLEDPMLYNGAEDGFTSPFRPDPRPMSGIYHAMFVLGRSVEVLGGVAEAAQDGRLDVAQPSSTYMADIVQDLRQKFKDLEPMVATSARLSDRGAEIFERCRLAIAGA